MDRWSISVPGVPAMVPVTRLFVRAFLAGNPLAGDAELITSEYATNAIRYGAAGEGGTIRVTVSTGPGLVRIEVSDHAAPGGLARPDPLSPELPAGRPGEEDQTGRGLLLVDAIADRWGHDGAAGHRTAWAELRARPRPGTAPA